MRDLDCTRFSLGDFERPVHMFMEWADLSELPEDCRRDNATYIPFILSGIWVNDTEVADFLSDTYGITTYVAEFEVEKQADQVVWRMHHDGKTSELSVQVSDDRTQWTDLKQRLYWFPESGGVGVMDWDIVRDTAESKGLTLARGHLESPLLMSEWPTEYDNLGEFAEAGIYRGEIQLYEDVLCKEPR